MPDRHSGHNLTCGSWHKAWFHSGANCLCFGSWESLSAAQASYALVTHSIHCCFLSTDCVILCCADMWNRCLPMVQLPICSVHMSDPRIYLLVFFAKFSSLVFPQWNSFWPTHWLIPYCHIPETRFEVHTAWSLVSPWCSLSQQYKVFALLQWWPSLPWIASFQPIDNCSWNAVDTIYPILSSNAGVGFFHWAGPPVDHCEMPWLRVAIMNWHVDVFIVIKIALAQAVVLILGPCGHWNTQLSVS